MAPEKLKCADYSADDSFACYSRLRESDRRANPITVKESAMWSRALVGVLLLSPLAGCTHFWQRYENCESGPMIVGAGSGGGVAAETGLCGDQFGYPSTNCAPACPPKPSCPPQPKVIRIKVVQPKVEEAKQGQGAPAPPQAQAFSAPQEVMLVPRTVFVPFVAQTPTGPARILSLQGAVPLVAPPAEQREAAPPQKEGAPQPKEGAPKKEEEKKECPSSAPIVHVIKPCCPPDFDVINQRLDRLETLLQQLCAPPFPPPPRSLGPN